VRVAETGCQLIFLVLIPRELAHCAPGSLESVRSHVRGQPPSRGLEFEFASTSLGYRRTRGGYSNRHGRATQKCLTIDRLSL
jgi:hypothetical protein